MEEQIAEELWQLELQQILWEEEMEVNSGGKASQPPPLAARVAAGSGGKSQSVGVADKEGTC